MRFCAPLRIISIITYSWKKTIRFFEKPYIFCISPLPLPTAAAERTADREDRRFFFMKPNRKNGMLPACSIPCFFILLMYFSRSCNDSKAGNVTLDPIRGNVTFHPIRA